MVLRSSLAFGRGRVDQFPRQDRSSASKIMEVEHCAACNGAATAAAGCVIKDGIMTATMDINRERIAATEAVIRPHIRRTPLVEADLADFGLPASPVTFKLEMLQHSGSFKARGAFANLLLRRLPEAGVVAASGGNHGAAVAYAAQRLGIPATIFVPDITSPAQAERIRGYGAKLVIAGSRYAVPLAASETHVAQNGAPPPTRRPQAKPRSWGPARWGCMPTDRSRPCWARAVSEWSWSRMVRAFARWWLEPAAAA